jgi:hypothetical protein
MTKKRKLKPLRKKNLLSKKRKLAHQDQAHDPPKKLKEILGAKLSPKQERLNLSLKLERPSLNQERPNQKQGRPNLRQGRPNLRQEERNLSLKLRRLKSEDLSLIEVEKGPFRSIQERN